MAENGAPEHTNRLADETSPYLLQHAHNPVDWYPWGPEALERAAKEDKPILLSIGYAACHWCHVMERESFENERVARLMNEHFVPVKVDREERPDLDDIYMTATVAMSGGGGWPMTVFLTPDQRPFFAGTYFPPEDKYGRPGFRSLLERIAELWTGDRAHLEKQAAELTEHVVAQSGTTRPAPVRADAIDEAVKVLAMQFDPDLGGFGSAPKFPPHGSLELLLRHHHRTGDERSLEMVTRTLDAMHAGGIYDHLAGGFARYSTDDRWLVPHFEKMLYDNAQLARAYLWAHQVTGSARYRRVAAETLDYVVREMQDERGGYYSATDADSEGVEGKFFVWTPDEIEDALGRDAADAFCAYYDVTPGGNWEGTSILNTPRTLEAVADELGVEPDALRSELETSRKTLYEARLERVPPLLDDKVLTAWNALMIGAMAEGYRILRDRRYLESADRAARYALGELRRDDGGLFRTVRGGKAHLDGYLEDYAYLVDALVDLHEAGGDTGLLESAVELAARLVEDFGDPEGGAFFHTAREHEQLLVRTREGHDGPIPNPNAVAARALARLSHHLDREELRDRAAGALRAYGRQIERQPRGFPTALGVVDFLLQGPVELVFAGDSHAEDVEALASRVAEHYLPNRIVGHTREDDTRSRLSLPLLEGKGRVDGKAALYVCRDFTCKAPVTDPSRVGDALEAGVKTGRETGPHEIGATTVPGRATATGTARRVERFASRYEGRGFVELGRTGLSVSRLGFGGYRIDDGAPEHRAALRKALSDGVNLVDTSTNYTDGRSERLVGEVIRELDGDGDGARDELVIVSKIGYVQGKNLEIAEAREQVGRPYPEMVKVEDGLWHCLHPEWLDDQLGLSLGRLGLETLDVCLLHNPEYFLSDAVQRGRGPLDDLRTEFYHRLERAFGHLEEEVRRGRIGAYGVSSNTSTAPAGDREATDLARMVEAAKRAGGDEHHFRVLQLPMNLFESGAASEKNADGASTTVLDFARAERVAVLVNRPLNAIGDAGLVRLADPPPQDDAPHFQAQLSKVERLESEYRREIASSLRAAPDAKVTPESLLNWADQLGGMPARIASYEQWSEIEGHVVVPRLLGALSVLDRAMPGPAGESWRDFRDRYLPELEGLLAALRQRAAAKSRARADAISRAIDATLPEERRAEPLSRKALWILASTPGVTTVLVGMRSTAYVDDALAVMGWEVLADPDAVYAALQDQKLL